MSFSTGLDVCPSESKHIILWMFLTFQLIFVVVVVKRTKQQTLTETKKAVLFTYTKEFFFLDCFGADGNVDSHSLAC